MYLPLAQVMPCPNVTTFPRVIPGLKVTTFPFAVKRSRWRDGGQLENLGSTLGVCRVLSGRACGCLGSQDTQGGKVTRRPKWMYLLFREPQDRPASGEANRLLGAGCSQPRP